MTLFQLRGIKVNNKTISDLCVNLNLDQMTNIYQKTITDKGEEITLPCVKLCIDDIATTYDKADFLSGLADSTEKEDLHKAYLQAVEGVDVCFKEITTAKTPTGYQQCQVCHHMVRFNVYDHPKNSDGPWGWYKENGRCSYCGTTWYIEHVHGELSEMKCHYGTISFKFENV